MSAPTRRLGRWASAPATGAAALLLGLVLLPVVALFGSSSPSELAAGASHPMFWPALTLSARTSACSLVLVVLGGTPLAWWLATTPSQGRRLVETLVDLPIVIPPAVLGVALLQAFGRQGLLGPWLSAVWQPLPFTTAAVVVAQVVVSTPFYVQGAAAAFAKVDPDLMLVARTLGAGRQGAVLRVAVPMALPGLISGAALAWARGLGEFGATLLFAGNLAGTTRTMPLAILTALESDLPAALALAVALASCGGAVLVLMRAVPWLGERRTRSGPPTQGQGAP